MTAEYNIKVTVRNNLLLKAIENAGYKSQSDFARAAGLTQSTVNALVAMRSPPIGQLGEFSKAAKVIMEVLGASPNELWTEKQLHAELPKNTYTREISEQQLLEIAGGVGVGCIPALDDCPEIRQQEMEAAIRNFLYVCTPRQERILRMRFGLDGEDEHTYGEIAEKMDVTRERVRQIEMKALQRIRAFKAKKNKQARSEGKANLEDEIRDTLNQ